MEESFSYCGRGEPESQEWLDEFEQVQNKNCPERRITADGWASKKQHPWSVRNRGYLPTAFDLSDFKPFERDAESPLEDAADCTDWLSAYSSDPEGLSRFCAGRDLIPHLKVAIRLARNAFPDYKRLSLQVENDPESESEWVDVNVAVGVNASQVLEHYEQWVTDWVQATEPETREVVHLTFHFD